MSTSPELGGHDMVERPKTVELSVAKKRRDLAFWRTMFNIFYAGEGYRTMVPAVHCLVEMPSDEDTTTRRYEEVDLRSVTNRLNPLVEARVLGAEKLPAFMFRGGVADSSLRGETVECLVFEDVFFLSDDQETYTPMGQDRSKRVIVPLPEVGETLLLYEDCAIE